MINNKINITDFNFEFSGYGHYKVTYTSPKTGKEWRKTITNMELIDATKNEDYPKLKNLIELKSTIKSDY
jgi:hypothetical protein